MKKLSAGGNTCCIEKLRETVSDRFLVFMGSFDLLSSGFGIRKNAEADKIITILYINLGIFYSARFVMVACV